MKKQLLILAVAGTFVFAGCAGMSTTEQRVLSGGAIGASGGALVGWAAGNPTVGAAVGGGAGALGGLIYDQFEKSHQAQISSKAVSAASRSGQLAGHRSAGPLYFRSVGGGPESSGASPSPHTPLPTLLVGVDGRSYAPAVDNSVTPLKGLGEGGVGERLRVPPLAPCHNTVSDTP